MIFLGGSEAVCVLIVEMDQLRQVVVARATKLIQKYCFETYSEKGKNGWRNTDY